MSEEDEQKQPVFKIRFLLGLVLIILILLIAGYFAYKKFYKPSAQVAGTAKEIRTIFSLSSSTQPSFTPPNPGQAVSDNIADVNQSMPQNQPPAPASNNNSPRGPEVAGTSTPSSNTTTPAQTPQADTGPNSWTIKQKDYATYYYGPNGELKGYIESYNNSGQSLSDLEQILQGSSSVKNVEQIVVGSQPALKYYTYEPGGDGIAMLGVKKIYYLHGAWADPEVAKYFNPE